MVKRKTRGTKEQHEVRGIEVEHKTKEEVRETVSEGKRKEPRQLTRLGREVPVRAQCPRQAPGACYCKRHTPHAARL